jgi:hypothetical protein
MVGSFWVAAQLAASQKGLSSMKLVSYVEEIWSLKSVPMLRSLFIHLVVFTCPFSIREYIVTRFSAYGLASDWRIGFIDILYNEMLLTSNTALSLIYTIYSSPLHTH